MDDEMGRFLFRLALFVEGSIDSCAANQRDIERSEQRLGKAN